MTFFQHIMHFLGQVALCLIHIEYLLISHFLSCDLCPTLDELERGKESCRTSEALAVVFLRIEKNRCEKLSGVSYVDRRNDVRRFPRQ